MNDINPTPDDTTPEAIEPATDVSDDGTTPVASEPLTEVAAATEFATAAEAPEMGFFAEFWDFLVHNKAWWLTPIILVLALVFVLVWFAATPFAPFIYGA